MAKKNGPVVEADQSLDEQTSKVRRAFREQYRSTPAGLDSQIESYVRDVFDGYVIACIGDEDYQIPYATADDGSIAFDSGAATKVEQKWVAVGEADDADAPLGEFVEIFEAADQPADAPKGRVWDVVIIRSGVSKNGFRYSPAVLREAAPLFEGVRVMARTDDEHLEGRAKSVRNIVGWIDGVRFDAKLGAMVGRLHVSEAADWLRVLLVDAFAQGKRDIAGLSIVAAAAARPMIENGRRLVDVTKIVEAKSVDVVFDPSAGGGFVRLVAAVDDRQEGRTSMAPAADAATATKPVAEMTLEELKAAAPQLWEQAVQAAKDAETPETPPADPPADDDADKPPAGELVGAGAAAVAEAVDEKKIPSYLAGIVVEAELGRSKLPEPTQTKIRKRFDNGSAIVVTDLREAIADEVAYFADLEKAGLVQSRGRSAGDGSGVAVGIEEADRAKAALDGLFLGEPVEVDGQKIRPYRGIREAYVDLTGDTSVSGLLPRQPSGKLGISEAAGGAVQIRLGDLDEDGKWKLSEAISTATFPLILGDSIRRAMQRDYNRAAQRTWGNLVDIVPASDFRTNRRERWGGYGNLPAVAQAAAYVALTSPGEFEATYAVTKRGGLETITLETITNDDLGTIRRVPQKLAWAAAQTLHEFVYDFLATNAAVYDAVALGNAAHGGNLATAALAGASLSARRLNMAKQAELSNSKRIGLIAKHLYIPVELEETAYTLVRSDQKPGTADNDANFLRDQQFDYTVVPYWTDTNNWFLTADKAQIPLIELAFLGGEEPDIFVQDMQNVGSMFTNDQVTYKIRHIYGGAVLDWRGFDVDLVP